MILAGCCGWPVSRGGYFQRFRTVEINSSFYNLPQLATVRRWKQEAPPGFEYSLKAWQLLTHSSTSPTYDRLNSKPSKKVLDHCGHFRATDAVQAAWERTRAVASVLEPRFLLFQTPPSFYPGQDHLRDMYRFFKGIRRDRPALAWEARGRGWTQKLMSKVCSDLGLIPVADPTAPGGLAMSRRPGGGARYWRLHGGLHNGRMDHSHRYSDEELRRLRSECGNEPAYAYFNTRSMWDDAARFQALANPFPVPRRG